MPSRETSTWEDQQLAMLKGNYPGWDIWYVRCFQAPTSWCAKPGGAPVSTIQASSPEELIAAIAAAGCRS
jgi:hypothetical protein